MRKPKIKITLVDRIGKYGCHHGHKIGDTFDYWKWRRNHKPLMVTLRQVL